MRRHASCSVGAPPTCGHKIVAHARNVKNIVAKSTERHGTFHSTPDNTKNRQIVPSHAPRLPPSPLDPKTFAESDTPRSRIIATHQAPGSTTRFASAHIECRLRRRAGREGFWAGRLTSHSESSRVSWCDRQLDVKDWQGRPRTKPQASRSCRVAGWWNARFSWINNDRRLRKDCEDWPETSEAIIHLSMINVMLKRLTSQPLTEAARRQLAV